MKSMGIQSVERFPFPSPPRPDALQTALRCLVNIGALERHAITDDAGTAQRVVEMLTPLGEQLVKLPLHPRLGKMLVLGGYAWACVCAWVLQDMCSCRSQMRAMSQARAVAVHSRNSRSVQRPEPVYPPAIPSFAVQEEGGGRRKQGRRGRGGTRSCCGQGFVGRRQ